ncbi:glycerol-3-phosphate responsive antiterminator [Providencia manganoxydans]|uniref:glycerol-3-phosphate responsive antiterminator n=1 Tax=Providencia manganoxydans TaxID=2923283 RepID=UPI00293FD6E3|nr:glycerol-3-phosphate responsive antiterminator [Providencia stuartii]ELR5083503.1 glycerol-3-phosphate responsive antiterminator [Providencia stuartii]
MNLNNTIIPSVRNYKYFERALASHSEYILLPDADIGNLQSMIGKCHKAGKKVLVHLELLGGFKPDQAGVTVLKNFYKVDGVISSNFTALRYAKKEGLETIFRVLLVDSRSLEQASNMVKNYSVDVDAIELLPAEYACTCFDLLKRSFNQANTQFIAGGFVKRKYLVEKIFYTGFNGITTSEHTLW